MPPGSPLRCRPGARSDAAREPTPGAGSPLRRRPGARPGGREPAPSDHSPRPVRPFVVDAVRQRGAARPAAHRHLKDLQSHPQLALDIWTCGKKFGRARISFVTGLTRRRLLRAVPAVGLGVTALHAAVPTTPTESAFAASEHDTRKAAGHDGHAGFRGRTVDHRANALTRT